MEFEIYSIIFLILAGGLIALVVFLRPIVGFLLMVLIIPIENVIIFPGGVTWIMIVGIFVLTAWISRKIIMGESWNDILSANIIGKILLFIGFAL